MFGEAYIGVLFCSGNIVGPIGNVSCSCLRIVRGRTVYIQEICTDYILISKIWGQLGGVQSVEKEQIGAMNLLQRVP